MKLGKWWPVIAWMGLIFLVSAQQQLPTPEQRWLDFVLEKSGHALEFAVLALLLTRALGPAKRGWRSAFFIALFVSWVYALSDELHQSFVPGRAADWADVLFDWLGALLGVGLWALWWTTHRETRIDTILHKET